MDIIYLGIFYTGKIRPCNDYKLSSVGVVSSNNIYLHFIFLMVNGWNLDYIFKKIRGEHEKYLQLVLISHTFFSIKIVFRRFSYGL